MLINTIKNAYREFTGGLISEKPIRAIPARRPAANAGHFGKRPMQARRLRRQFRNERASSRRVNGWTVRSW
jgi:hypothetical protein